MLDITIILHNSEQQLEGLITSLTQQTFLLSDISLFIYDNNSSDKTLIKLNKLIQPIQHKFQQYKLIKGKTKLSYAKAHNLAIAQGDNDFIYILNPKTLLSKHTLAILFSTARQDKSDVSAWEARQSPYEQTKLYDPITLKTSWVDTTALLLRRKSFEHINGFRTHFCIYGEDVDLSWRLREAGTYLRYIPQSIVTYKTDLNSNKIPPPKLITSIRLNLFLSSQTNNLKLLYDGLRLHASLLKAIHQPVKFQFFRFFSIFIRRLLRLQQYTKNSNKTIDPDFSGWDYETSRTGAYHDISPCLSLKNDKTVSILIRSMGKQQLLAQALACINNQSYKAIEVVIIEDGQQTLDNFLKPYQKTLNINYQALEQNKGRCHAGNQAMKNASGDFCLFLDEDDLLYADHIEQLVIALKQHKARVAYSFAFELPSVYTENGDSIRNEGPLFSRFKRRFSFLALLDTNYLPINTVLFERSLFHECGGFDPEIELNEDWNLWVRFSIKHRPFINVPKTTAIYRVPSEQKLSTKRFEQLSEHRQRVKKLQEKLIIKMSVEELLELNLHEASKENPHPDPIPGLEIVKN